MLTQKLKSVNSAFIKV